MNCNGQDLVRFARWILFLPAALLIFFLLLSVPDTFIGPDWFIIPKVTLATFSAILITKKIAPTATLSVPLAALVTNISQLLAIPVYLLALRFSFNLPAGFTHAVEKSTVFFIGWLIGLILALIVSTSRGVQRDEIVRSLRWVLFFPVSLYITLIFGKAALLLCEQVHIILPGESCLAIPIGIWSCLFIGSCGLLVPSLRAVFTFLGASFSFVVMMLTIRIAYSEFSMRFQAYTNFKISENVPIDKSLAAWLIGTFLGGTIVLLVSSLLRKTPPEVTDLIHTERRYKGTSPYQDIEIDRKTFFGRDHESRSLLHFVLAERLVVLFAKSGLGKSSLINTTLIDQLRKRGYFPIVTRLNEPGSSLCELLISQVQAASSHANIDIVARSQNDLWQFFKTAEFWSEDNDLLKPVLIIDQFEELFTMHGHSDRYEFINSLKELVRGRNTEHRLIDESGRKDDDYDTDAPQVKILLSLREDFLAHLEELAADIPSILHNRFRLGPLNHEAAMQAITKPASLSDPIFQTQRFTYQPAAVQRIIDFLSQRNSDFELEKNREIEPVQLQLMCHYFEEIVQQKQRSSNSEKEIVLSADDLGGEKQMQRIMEGFYDRIISSIKPFHKAHMVQRLCEKRLVSSTGKRLTEDGDEIKQHYRLSDKILKHLVDSRLLRAEPRLGGIFYEISHDRLIEPIIKARSNRFKERKLMVLAALFFTIFVGSGSVILISDYKKRLATKGNLEFTMLSTNAEEALRSGILLLEQSGFSPADIITKIQRPAVVNPAVLVIPAASSHSLTPEEQAAVLKHIENYFNTEIEDKEGAPTLLGTSLFIYDKLDGPKDTVNYLSKTYYEKYSDNSTFSHDTARKQKMTAKSSKLVTNREFKRFYKFHEPADNEPVTVNWFEAYGYSVFANRQLPGKKEIPGASPGDDVDCDIAYQYADMYADSINPNDQQPSNTLHLLEKLIGQHSVFGEKTTFCIFLPE